MELYMIPDAWNLVDLSQAQLVMAFCNEFPELLNGRMPTRICMAPECLADGLGLQPPCCLGLELAIRPIQQLEANINKQRRQAF